jgi:hypothetical protein
MDVKQSVWWINNVHPTNPPDACFLSGHVSDQSHEDRFSIAIHGFWFPAQFCLEQICINPKCDRQDILARIPAGMTSSVDTYVLKEEGIHYFKSRILSFCKSDFTFMQNIDL